MRENEVTLQLQRKISGGEYENVVGGEQTLTSNDGWTNNNPKCTFDELDLTNTNGEAYIYRVLESKICDTRNFYYGATIVNTDRDDNQLVYNSAEGKYTSYSHSNDTDENCSGYHVFHSGDIILNEMNGNKADVTITNTLEQTTSLNVTIKWKDTPEGEKPPEKIVLMIEYARYDENSGELIGGLNSLYRTDSDDYKYSVLEMSKDDVDSDGNWMTCFEYFPSIKTDYSGAACEVRYKVRLAKVYSADGQEYIQEFVEDPGQSGYVQTSGNPWQEQGYRPKSTDTEDGTEIEMRYSTYVPLTVKKIWNDGTTDNDKAVQEGYTATVQLYKVYYDSNNRWNSEKVGDAVTLSGDNDYQYTWKSLPAVDPSGEYNLYYLIEETGYSPDGVKCSTKYYGVEDWWTNEYYFDVSGVDYQDYLVLPAYVPQEWRNESGYGDDGNPYKDSYTLYMVNTPLISVTVEKEWKDHDNKEKSRPKSVTVQIDDNQTAYDLMGQGFDYSFALDGETKDDNIEVTPWVGEVNLPAAKLAFTTNSEGKYTGAYTSTPYEYHFKESFITYADGSTDSVSNGSVGDYSISYVYPSNTETVITNTWKDFNKYAFLTGTMTWSDSDNQYKTRPDNVELVVKKVGSGSYVPPNEEILNPDITWKKPENSNKWTYSISGLDKTENGKDITYKVEIVSTQGNKLTGLAGANYTLLGNGTTTPSGNVFTTNFTGTLVTGNLLISKTVENLPDGEAQKDYNFNFKVKVTGGSSVYYTGVYTVYSEDATADNITPATIVKTGTTTDGTIEIAGGQKFYLIGLPAGYTYTVEEVPIQGFAIDTIPKGTIEEGKIAEGEVVNRWDPTSNVPGKPNPDPKPDDPKPDNPDPDNPKPDNPNSDSNTPTETSETSGGTVASNVVVNSSDSPTKPTVASLGSKTGDSLAIYLWIMLFGIGAAGAVVAGGRLKRRKDQAE